MMLQQIKYAIEDIRERKLFFASYFLQILIGLLAVSFLFSSGIQLFSFRQKLLHFQNLDEIYFMKDVTNEDYLNNSLFQSPTVRQDLFRFYHFLKTSKGFTSYSFYAEEGIVVPLTQSKKGEKKPHPILYIDSAFQNIFSLKCTEGTLFLPTDFEKKASLSPVLLGANYRGQFHKGDIIEHQYEVRGFLESQSFYLDPKKTNEILYLDDAVIFPLILNEASELGALDMAINNTCILTKNPASLVEIEQKSASMALFTYEFISMEQQLHAIIQSELRTIQLLLLPMSLVLALCTICMISSLFIFVQKRQREFAVHLLCGCNMFLLVFRLCLQVWLVVCIAALLTGFLFHELSVTLFILSFSVLICLLTTLPPSIKLLHTDIAQILKRSE